MTSGALKIEARSLKAKFPHIQIIAVDAEGSVIFGGQPKSRSVPGIGSSISPPLLRFAAIDDVVYVSEDDLRSGCKELMQKHGIFAGGSSGAVYFAIKSFFSNKRIANKPNVIFLCADGGEAYKKTVYGESTAKV